MDSVFIVLIILNLVLGFGFAIPTVKYIRRRSDNSIGFFKCFILVLGIYFFEGIALGMGMGIPVFNVLLAFIWGVVFGVLLYEKMSELDTLKTSFFLSLYSAIPAFTFIAVPVMCYVNGREILNAEEGIRFGIPELPHFLWFFNTILVFYVTIIIGAFIFKSVITIGEVSLFIHLKKIRNRIDF